MKIVGQSAELMWITPDPEKTIEKIARVCYKSENAITADSYKGMIRNLLKNRHGAMLEHASASIKFVTERGVSHELVRHRVASFAQESSRYCNYAKDKFGREITVVKPPYLNPADEILWRTALAISEESYMKMIDNKVRPEIARSVLPTCLKTEIVVTANFREWLHIFSLRLDAQKAHPQIVELMGHAKAILDVHAPTVFGG